MDPEKLKADLERLEAYAASLPEGAERTEIEETISEGQASLKRYTESQQAQPGTTPEEDVDLSDEDIDAMIATLKSETSGAPQRRDNAERPTGTLKLYSGPQGERLASLERDRIDTQVDALVEKDKITPAQAVTVKRMCYTLKGLPDQGTLKVYSEQNADTGVADLLSLFSEADGLGVLQSHTRANHRQTEADRANAQGAGAAQGGRVPVNESSAELDRAVRAYAEKKGIKDYREALIQFERDQPQEVKRYMEGG